MDNLPVDTVLSHLHYVFKMLTMLIALQGVNIDFIVVNSLRALVCLEYTQEELNDAPGILRRG